jgi:DNA-binding beta-propeller fold protein YncE
MTGTRYAAGNLYAANFGNKNIEKFNSSGVGTVFASTGSSYPEGLAFDSAGNLSVSNAGYNSTIEEFNSTGAGTVFASGLFYPRGLAFDNSGNLYVASYTGNSIEEFKSSGGVLSSNGTVFASSGLDGPYGLAFQSIPEPSTWVLLAGGLIALLSVRQRRGKG